MFKSCDVLRILAVAALILIGVYLTLDCIDRTQAIKNRSTLEYVTEDPR